MNFRRFLLFFFTSATGAIAAFPSHAAETYPNRPIRVVIPFAAGGFVDNIIRSMGPGLSQDLGQPVIVENRPGGGAQIAAGTMKNSPADGYTVFAAEISAFAINPTMYKNLSYSPQIDFEPLAALLKAPMVMYTSPNGKINSGESLSEILSGKELFYSSTGPGTGGHILGHLLSKGVPSANLTHVPYNGAPAATTAVLSKEVDFNFDAVAPVLNLSRSKKVVPLAIAATERSSFFPNVPTTSELGQPNVQMEVWIGTAVKKGTPADIVKRLAEAFDKAMDKPEVLNKFKELGWDRFHLSREEFGNFIMNETNRYRPVILDSGAAVN